jgi:hypothetical protein
VRSRLVPLRSRLGSSLGTLPARGRRSSPAMGLACDASVRRPVAARLPATRDGAVSAGHLPPVQRHGTALDRVVKERGETGEAPDEIASDT